MTEEKAPLLAAGKATAVQEELPRLEVERKRAPLSDSGKEDVISTLKPCRRRGANGKEESLLKLLQMVNSREKLQFKILSIVSCLSALRKEQLFRR